MGLMSQQEGKRQAIEIIGKELVSLQPLLQQGIIPATRVYALQRDAADLTGELGSLGRVGGRGEGQGCRNRAADHPAWATTGAAKCRSSCDRRKAIPVNIRSGWLLPKTI
jgi:hypothetical protein